MRRLKPALAVVLALLVCAAYVAYVWWVGYDVTHYPHGHELPHR